MTMEFLREAKTLAKFSNLTAAGADYFKHNYPNFLPEALWLGAGLKSAVPNDTPFEDLQLPGANRGDQLTASHAVSITLSKEQADAIRHELLPLWQEFQTWLRDTWRARFPLEKCIALISAAGNIPHAPPTAAESEPQKFEKPKVWPYQRAVMLLGVEPWRARFCVCGKRFVADKPSRRFCSTRCSSDARKVSRRAWWSEHGKQWRGTRRHAKRKTKRASPKSKKRQK